MALKWGRAVTKPRGKVVSRKIKRPGGAAEVDLSRVCFAMYRWSQGSSPARTSEGLGPVKFGSEGPSPSSVRTKRESTLRPE